MGLKEGLVLGNFAYIEITSHSFKYLYIKVKSDVMISTSKKTIEDAL